MQAIPPAAVGSIGSPGPGFIPKGRNWFRFRLRAGPWTGLVIVQSGELASVLSAAAH